MIAPDREQVQQYDVAAIMGGLYGDGIIGLKGAFDRAWVEDLRQDMERLYAEALQRPGVPLPDDLGAGLRRRDGERRFVAHASPRSATSWPVTWAKWAS